MIGISAIVIAATTLVTTVPQAAALAGLDDTAAFAPGANPTAAELSVRWPRCSVRSWCRRWCSRWR